MVLRIKHKALYTLGKYSTSELNTPTTYFLIKNKDDGTVVLIKTILD